MEIIETKQYAEFLNEVKGRINAAQSAALKAVNRALVLLYWDIGRLIAEKQKREKWGDAVIENLAKDLQGTFPGIKGFSVRNLWYMRDFYTNYHDKEKLQTLSAEISWSHNVAILGKCNDDSEREFYVRMARKHSWSYRILLSNIENQTYEKTLLGQNNFDTTLPVNI